MRVLAVAAALALSLAAAAGCGGHDQRAPAPAAAPAPAPAPAPGPAVMIPTDSAAPLPALEYKLRSGEPWKSSSTAGRVLVLYVWATYCPSCRKSFPKLGQLAAANPDVVVIGVSVDEEDDVVEAFLREVPAAFPIARDPTQTVQSGELGLEDLPTLFLVDRQGRVRLRREPMTEPDYAAIPGMLAALLAEQG
jgi:thiol-disulfide isomerase/thioredoxin